MGRVRHVGQQGHNSGTHMTLGGQQHCPRDHHTSGRGPLASSHGHPRGPGAVREPGARRQGGVRQEQAPAVPEGHTGPRSVQPWRLDGRRAVPDTHCDGAHGSPVWIVGDSLCLQPPPVQRVIPEHNHLAVVAEADPHLGAPRLHANGRPLPQGARLWSRPTIRSSRVTEVVGVHAARDEQRRVPEP
jgi:hypothetical protein